MAPKELIFSRAWRVLLNAMRATLGLVCLASQMGASPPGSNELNAALAAYCAFAILALFWSPLRLPGMAVLCLCIDTVFFLVFSTWGRDPNLWLSSVLFLYLMLLAVIKHDWSDVFIVSGVSIGFFGLVHGPEAEPLRRLVLFSGLLACVLGFQRHRLQDRLSAAQKEAERSREEAERARADERQRIAGDFHDGPLQSFISFQVRLDILRRLLERDRGSAVAEVKQLQELSKDQVAELRSFLRTMRPQAIEGSDLVAYVRRMTEDFQKDTGIPARFAATDAAITAPPEMCQEVLQIVREALKNVQKHSRAGRVSVGMERAGKCLEIAVDDNGSGFSFGGSFTLDELELLRLGPQSIKQRVRSLGGELIVDSRPGHGAGLKIRIPA